MFLLEITACTTPSSGGHSSSIVVAPQPKVSSDRDRDGIPDNLDKCPDEPEDIDRFEDEDGCADRDNDKDGIPDAKDFVDGRWTNCDFSMQDGTYRDCRNLPEDHNGAHDLDGCPEVLTCVAPPLIAEIEYDELGFTGVSATEKLSLAISRLRREPRTQFLLVPPIGQSTSDETDRALVAMKHVAEVLVAQGANRNNIIIGHKRAGAHLRRKGESDMAIDVYIDPQCPCKLECRRELVCR